MNDRKPKNIRLAFFVIKKSVELFYHTLGVKVKS